MMSETISFAADAKLKRDFELLCGDMGLSVGTVFTMLMKRSLLTNCIPFPIAGDPFYSDLNMDAIRRQNAEIDAGKGEEHELIEKE